MHYLGMMQHPCQQRPRLLARVHSALLVYPHAVIDTEKHSQHVMPVQLKDM
jgi:hypothetical protein